MRTSTKALYGATSLLFSIIIISLLFFINLSGASVSVEAIEVVGEDVDGIDVHVDAEVTADTIASQPDKRSSDQSDEHSLLAEEEEEETSPIQEEIRINNSNLQYTPPSYFQITAHVQTNLHTGYSYFLPKESLSESFAHLPFLECGAVGSTTESLPLVSGVFRHVPHQALVPKRDDSIDIVLENLNHVVEEEDDTSNVGLDGLNIPDEDEEGEKSNTTDDGPSSESMEDNQPKRPSPPKYVVALSSMEITVGGNGNETQQFNAGDVIFVEDTWWGVWDSENEEDNKTEDMERDETKMKGYIMRASSESETEDLNVLMLTVPNAIHRHWKNAQLKLSIARREEEQVAKQQEQKQSSPRNNENFGFDTTRRPWWKMPTTFLHKHKSKEQDARYLPEPCSLESDPTFAHPSVISSTTLKQHFTQHFTNLLRRSTNPHPSFLPHHHQDLLLPILAQTTAAIIGGAASLALVLQLFRRIPGPTAVGFGSACLVGLGTWGFVWLGEEVMDQWELWRERRRLEWMMSEGWGKGGGTNGGGSTATHTYNEDRID